MQARPLVQTGELADELRGDRPPTLLDVRWRLGGPPGEQAYREGHLPGAVYVDLDTVFAGPPGDGGRHPLPAAADLTTAMREAGVRRATPVVVYDAGGSMAAARAWWCLSYFGHGDVRVLDGGYRAWQADGYPVTWAVPSPAAGDFRAEPGHLPLLDAGGAADVAGAGVLLDARTPQRYFGEQEPVDPVAGHIPGAVNAPTTDNGGADGRFLPADVLGDRFAQLGVAGGTPTGAYCGSGVSAAHTVLALAVAGVSARLYVGSWSEWIRDPSRPVATDAGHD